MLESIILTVVTTTVGYIFGYKKNKNEIETGKLDNLEKSIHIYQVMIDDLSKKVEDLTFQITKLEGMIDIVNKKCFCN